MVSSMRWRVFRLYLTLLVLDPSTLASSSRPLSLTILSSNKCLGGRCVVTLMRDASDRHLYELTKAAGNPDSPARYLSSNDLQRSLLDGATSHPGLINPHNSVVIWPDGDSPDLVEYLAMAGKDTWKGEHYILMERSPETVSSELEKASVRLRLDTKLFFLVTGEPSIAAYEIYGISSTSVTVMCTTVQDKLSNGKTVPLIFLQSNFQVRRICTWSEEELPCDPMFGIWRRRSDLTGVNLAATYLPVPPNAIKMGNTLTGYFPDIFYILQESLNFTHTLKPRAPGGFGSKTVWYFLLTH